MDARALGQGWVGVLLECDSTDVLIDAAEAVQEGQAPARIIEIINAYASQNNSSELVIDPDFGAAPIGFGSEDDGTSPEAFVPKNSRKFIVRAFIKAESRERMPHETAVGRVYSDTIIGSYLTGGSSRAVGETAIVREKLGVETLGEKDLDGLGVAIAIMDSGIYLPHLTRLWMKQELDPALALGTPKPYVDAGNSWTPDTLATTPGMHRIGHGTMCAYDALIAAPKATLLDMPMLLARPLADHSAQATISAAMQAYWSLITKWVINPVLGKGEPPYKALVVSNSWGIFHPSLDFDSTHPGRFIDNPDHIFRTMIKVLAHAGVDVVFAASNCGPDCPSPVCLTQTGGMIMGANAYPEVLTIAGCDVHDERVGYSSKGPAIAMVQQRPNMAPQTLPPAQKPDLTAYTHFLGSKTFRSFAPDSGTSAACAVAAGCVAALRTKAERKGTSSAALFQALKDTALKPAGPNWNPGNGHGIIRPVAAAQSLGLIS